MVRVVGEVRVRVVLRVVGEVQVRAVGVVLVRK